MRTTYLIHDRADNSTRAEWWVSRLSTSITPVVVVLWLLLFLAGCTSATELAPPPAEMRDRLGTVAVTAVPFAGTVANAVPARGSAADAAEGAVDGALIGLRAAAELGWYLGAEMCAGTGGEAAVMCLAIVAATFPAAVLFGAAVGAVNGYGATTGMKAPKQDLATLPQQRPEVELRRRFLRLGAVKTEVRLVDADAAAGMEGTHDGDPAVPHDSRIEIEVTRFALDGHDRSGSEMWIELAARARIVLPGEVGQPYLRNWRYSGPRRRYFEPAQDLMGVEEEALLLPVDLNTAFEVLADKMVFDLLVATEPEIRRGEPEPGTAWAVQELKL